MTELEFEQLLNPGSTVIFSGLCEPMTGTVLKTFSDCIEIELPAGETMIIGRDDAEFCSVG